MITTINEFKKTLNENLEEICYIEFLNKDKKFKKDRIEFTGPNAFNDAVEWGRKNLQKFNADMISFDTKNVNENWFSNIFKRKPKRVTPEYTPDPIPAGADWWWSNDIFVFGSNTQGNHAGGAARAAVVNYGAIMGQARGLQGKSYGIVTLDYTGKEPVTLETIGQELDNFIQFAKSHQSLTFWMTKIGTGISRIPFEDIAQLFFDRQFPSNVKLPKEFSK